MVGDRHCESLIIWGKRHSKSFVISDFCPTRWLLYELNNSHYPNLLHANGGDLSFSILRARQYERCQCNQNPERWQPGRLYLRHGACAFEYYTRFAVIIGVVVTYYRSRSHGG